MNRIITILAVIVVSSLRPVYADDGDELSHGEIAVHLKGPLTVVTQLKANAAANSPPRDDAAWEIVGATIRAGHTVIELDWNGSKAIRDELLWWRIPRHGDVRIVEADVVGKMTFRLARPAEPAEKDAASDSTDNPVPVVIVESLMVQLVAPNGKPSGKQFDRGRVTAE